MQANVYVKVDKAQRILETSASEFAVELRKIGERDNVMGNSYAMFGIGEAVGRPQMFIKIGVLKIFADFARKILCLSPFLIKIQG